jgi:hypothetical protein
MLTMKNYDFYPGLSFAQAVLKELPLEMIVFNPMTDSFAGQSFKLTIIDPYLY